MMIDGLIMNDARILITGIGNIFLGDDAFGVEVARRLFDRPMPANVRVVDFGIRGIDLTYALLDGCDIAILIDAVARGQAPGTLYLIEPEITSESSQEMQPASPLLDMHDMDPAKVLRLVKAMGGGLRKLFLIGCEPMPFDAESENAMRLSTAVEAALEPAVEMVEALLGRIHNNEFAVSQSLKGVSCHAAT
jgi:hydrogenase maturation protease